MSQSPLQRSSAFPVVSSLSLASLILLSALLLMGMWLIKGTTDSAGLQSDTATSVSVTMPVTTESHESATTWTVASASDIPFPLYPNATRYRIGGQNGLKLALFETADEFGEVDLFYAEKANATGLSRKVIMPDYVQYDDDASAIPPTTGEKPGVLIYAFFDARDAQNAGATPDARTSIIISYR